MRNQSLTLLENQVMIFPIFHLLKEMNVFQSPVYLKEVIRQTIFSIADNDNNKLMTGELFEIEENQLKVVSLDGHRISIRNIELKNNYDHKKVVVPGKTLQEVSKILPEVQRKKSIFSFQRIILYLN